jgi:hypothetical protein
MAFLRNDAVNRVNLHSAVQALAQSGGGVFFVVFLLRVGLAAPVALTAMAAIHAGRFLLRPAILPLARRWGLKPLLILGTLGLAAQYPLLAEVHGVGRGLMALCCVAALGDILYWPTYHAYFASVGDAEHRGHQIGAREALVSVAGIVAPLLGAWALVSFGARPMFAAVAVIQAAAVLPLIGAPNVAVAPSAPGAIRAARLGMILSAADGWFDACFIFAWQIVLFVSLGESFAAYGGAMALAGLVAAAFGLLLGRHIDAGMGRRAVVVSYGLLATVVIVRAASVGSPWLAVGANALGALLGSLLLPATTAVANLAKASPCAMRFQIVSEAGWDVGCLCGCLAGAAIAGSGLPLSLAILLGLPPLGLAAALLHRHYRGLAVPSSATAAPS